MKLLYFALFLGLFSGWSAQSEERVVTLDSQQTFEDFVKNEKHTIIEFYAPWCGHCKQLAPQFEEAATTLHPKIKLAKVDCTTDENKDVCSKFGVRGYPTIKFFSNGEPSAYEGARTAEAIVNYVETHTGPAVADAESADQVAEVVKTSISAVLFQKEKSGGLREEFEKVAEGMRDEARFFHIADEAIATALGIDTSSDGVTLLRSFDEKVVKFAGKIADELKSFLGDESFPLCGKIGPENYMKYQQRELPLVWVAVDFDDKENDDSTHGVIPMAREAAKEHKGKLSIVYIDGEKFKGHLENLGLSGDLPGIVVTDADKKFLYSGDHTEAAIKDFLSKYAAGSLEPFLKSQEPPATNDGPVTIVVGKTFDKLVIDNDKCVLVEFYATWCGHCKELEPKYEDLGERFQDNDNVVIAKMDTPENDTPIEVKGFPTIKLFLPGKKDSPMDYNKGRTAEDLEEFIKEHCPGVGDETEEEDEEEQDTGKEEL